MQKVTTILRNKTIPIIFKNINRKSEVRGSNNSYSNNEEAESVVYYVEWLLRETWHGKKVLTKDIGMIKLTCILILVSIIINHNYVVLLLDDSLNQLFNSLHWSTIMMIYFNRHCHTVQ